MASIASVKGWATSRSACSANDCSSKAPMSYPAEKTGPSPVRSTQRASRPSTTSASVSRISWSRAPRFSGLRIRIRVTNSAGSSTTSFPEASSLLKHHQRVALRHRLPLLAPDLGDRPVVLGLDRHLHLHRLEDHERVSLRHLLPELALDLPDGAGDVGLDIGQI